jgi:hypothetical protein
MQPPFTALDSPALDSGLHSRLYDLVMATNHQAVTLMGSARSRDVHALQ